MRYEQWLRLRYALYACVRTLSGHVFPQPRWRLVTDYHSAWLLTGGSAGVEIAGVGRATAGPGEWLIVPPGERIQSFAPGSSLLSMAFYFDWLSGDSVLPGLVPTVLSAEAFPGLLDVAGRIERLLERQFPGHVFKITDRDLPLDAFLQVQRRLPEFLLHLIDGLRSVNIHPAGERQRDPKVIRALQIMEALPLNQTLTLPELAIRVGTSRAGLERLFAGEIGRSPRQFFEQRRLRHALDSLANPKVQVKEVSYRLGFDGLAQFSRWFHRLQGMSPREYRKQRIAGQG